MPLSAGRYSSVPADCLDGLPFGTILSRRNAVTCDESADPWQDTSMREGKQQNVAGKKEVQSATGAGG